VSETIFKSDHVLDVNDQWSSCQGN